MCHGTPRMLNNETMEQWETTVIRLALTSATVAGKGLGIHTILYEPIVSSRNLSSSSTLPTALCHRILQAPDAATRKSGGGP